MPDLPWPPKSQQVPVEAAFEEAEASELFDDAARGFVQRHLPRREPNLPPHSFTYTYVYVMYIYVHLRIYTYTYGVICRVVKRTCRHVYIRKLVYRLRIYTYTYVHITCIYAHLSINYVYICTLMCIYVHSRRHLPRRETHLPPRICT